MPPVGPPSAEHLFCHKLVFQRLILGKARSYAVSAILTKEDGYFGRYKSSNAVGILLDALEQESRVFSVR